ncbi:MAG: OmpA family protein [Lentisphaeria bacterium]|jgi:chemotaxis protein MotB
MKLPAWLWGLLFVLFAALGVCGYFLARQQRDLRAARAAGADLAAELARAQEANAGLAQAVAAREDALSELREKQASAARARDRLEEEMRQALASREVAISELQGKLTIDILDRILFASGEAELTPEGAAVLRQVAAVLRRYPGRQAMVFGHTDNVPIRGALAARQPTNWELAAARATAAVRFLAEQAGVDPRRLAAAACGEFRPVADNGTAAGRARNRRIELVVMPEELLPAEPGVAESAAPAPAPSPASPPPPVP